MRVVIASRKSDLARIQAYTVGQSLQKANPDLKIQFYFRESLGDINAKDPLWKMPEKGVFTEDFHQGLLSGEWDMVVHSWKDLPILHRQGTQIVATLPREDVRDLLLVKSSFQGGDTMQIFTSSPRREYNLGRSLQSLLPWPLKTLEFQPVRGNILTRIRKLLQSEAQGLVVAKAALDRILSTESIFDSADLTNEFSTARQELRQALAELKWMVLPIQLNPPAAAQGALAVEIKNDRDDLKALFQKIHCPETFACVEKERQMLQSWGGGCHQKIGVSVLQKKYGRITLAQGQSDQGHAIDIFDFAPQEQQTRTSFTYFPRTPQEGLWFDRHPESVDPEWIKCNAHYVSKAEALPLTVRPIEESLIWTSGIKTWQHLAQRGLWVNGSSESLGEDEDFRLQSLDALAATRQWAKWTHSQGEPSPGYKIIHSYRLTPRETPPQLSPETDNFFWMSGSSFEQAVSLYPWLINKTHWSGPGHTHQRLQQILSENNGKGVAKIALSFNQWQKMMEQKTSH